MHCREHASPSQPADLRRVKKREQFLLLRGAQLAEAAGDLAAIRAGPCVVNGAESRAFIVLVDLLVEGIGVAWGSAIPLLLLYDPGLWASVGVSKPAGASVAGCCAIPANPTAITPSSNTRTETHLCIIAFHLLKSGFVETHPVPIKGLPGEMQDHMRSRFIPNSFVENV